MNRTERRAHKRDRVIFGAKAAAKGKMAHRDCVVKNISEGGAAISGTDVRALTSEIELTIARKGRSFAARVVWADDTTAGVAFHPDAPPLAPDDAVMERLRATERQSRRLRQRVKDLSGEG